MIHIQISNEQLNRCKEVYFEWIEKIFEKQGNKLQISNLIDYFNLKIPRKSEYDLTNKVRTVEFLKSNKNEILNIAFNKDLEAANSLQRQNGAAQTSEGENYIPRNRSSRIYFGETLYNKLRSSTIPYQLYKEILGINVCPYCNKNSLEYIEYTSEETGEITGKISRIDIDHIKPKSDFSNLTIHFYNLMPCCHTCNLTKLANSYPSLFEENEGRFLFKFDFSKMSYEAIIQAHLSDNLNIKIEGLNDDLLKLEKRYNSDKGKIKSVLKRRYWYNEHYLKLIEKTLDEAGLSEYNSSELRQLDIHELLELHLSEKDYLTTPYSKMTKDLLNDMDDIMQAYQ
ncbi:HNH endonuclease [Salinicoccus bachuensis]|uniref:HNH endonuclease signature motif containing protein n=1 Tax=Salinicoccus bachuensis TaxID=3136731 RepID=A0ABZ3CKJ0_9STAP